MRLAAPLILALAALAACAPIPVEAPPPGGPAAPRGTVDSPTLAAQPRPSRDRGFDVVEATASGEELALVTSILAGLQARSFAENREFCGYVGLDAQDRWVSTPISGGTEATCPLPQVPPGLRLAASFHTHGTYSPNYASEWPTTQDVLTDAADRIDGYISTPGGRLWHVDTDTLTVRQLCGRGCLPQDPSYVAAEDGPLRPVLTLAQLKAWERGLPF
jgi:hypothetical protein